MNLGLYNSSEGIILDQNLNNGILFDFEFGKITYKPANYNYKLCRGAWVKIYRINNNIQEIKISAMPYALARTNLNFLHQVLRILEIATIWDNPAQEAKNILELLYNNNFEKNLINETLHKIFLGQLLIILGLTSNIPSKLHFWLMKDPIWQENYNSLSHVANDEMLDKLHSWLLVIIHEYGKVNKTLSFFP